MKMMKKIVSFVLLFVFVAGILAGCGSDTNKSFSNMADFEDSRIGVLMGSAFDLLAKEYYPEAEKLYYMNIADLTMNLRQDRIDGILMDKGFFTPLVWENKELTYIEMDMPETEYAVAFTKSEESEPLRAQMNEFIRNRRENGWIAELEKKWFSSSEPDVNIDMSELSGENGTLHVASSVESKPFDYLSDGKYYGFDAEFIYGFAEEYGYALQIDTMDFGALLPSINTGRYDLAISCITVTEERKESVSFSDAYHKSPVVMAVLSDNAVYESTSFFAGVKESFEKTFIRENRWKLICEGIAVTMIISVLSMIFGSLLGFLLYLMSKSTKKSISTLARTIGKIYSRIVAGTPVVVILMILFYLVFAEFKNLSGIVIAVVGFALTFGAFIYDHMAVSVDSVDFGQTEAALALGYSKNRTFFRIILPQAMTIFMPSYCGEVVALIKATAVVGYIAVNDLTKMGDIIRSNTYEAFFPLIATAAIYFVLTWIVASLLNIVKLKFEPKRRTEKAILKGVER